MSEPYDLQYARERYEDSLYQQFREDVLSGNDDLSAELAAEIIESFQAERLTSYYLANRALASPCISLFREAISLKTDHPTASLVFAVACVEVSLKVLLLIPILHGLIDSEPLAPLITRHFEKQRDGYLLDSGFHKG